MAGLLFTNANIDVWTVESYAFAFKAIPTAREMPIAGSQTEL